MQDHGLYTLIFKHINKDLVVFKAKDKECKFKCDLFKWIKTNG